MQEAEKVGEVQVIASSENEKFTTIPRLDGLLIGDEKLDYVHITTNNTIEGTKYVDIPHVDKVPLVADMSSNILSERYDVSKFGLIYAGAQKNLGPAGLTIAIIKKRFNWRSRSLLSYDVKLWKLTVKITPYTIPPPSLVFT